MPVYQNTNSFPVIRNIDEPEVIINTNEVKKKNKKKKNPTVLLSLLGFVMLTSNAAVVHWNAHNRFVILFSSLVLAVMDAQLKVPVLINAE